MERKTYRLWQPVIFHDYWQNCDTSILDDISAAWFARRASLQSNSQEYSDFLNQLKREHAIETGVIERLYDLKKGITETFIKEGFVQSYLSHGDTDISKEQLMKHLQDHLDAVNFIFDIVKENRPLSTSFIKELHHLTTQHQDFATGRNQFGEKIDIPLLKGTYKLRENNPTGKDGAVIRYCPPEQVASEMDNLVSIYNALVERGASPLIIATWFHHAFTTIHPFQDGNGRVARLLTSLIFIKFGYFPFTVLREEAKVKYIEALEEADKGKPQRLVNYFAEVQKRNIQKALNLKEVSSTSLAEMQKLFAERIDHLKQEKEEQKLKLETYRQATFDFCFEVLGRLKQNLEAQINGNAQISIYSSSFNEPTTPSYFHQEISAYAQKYSYYFNGTLPQAWLAYKIKLSQSKEYQLAIHIHHYGYGTSTLAIGALLEFEGKDISGLDFKTVPLTIPPHVIAIDDNLINKQKNIEVFLENALATALAQIISEI